ncbi:MAG TPA: carbohydrate kinase family protein [Patescibacteria group bacterium]|nr:carbohydrate kinase family protein [Patescibacteria group bacterium]
MKKFEVISIGSALKDIFILNKDMSCQGAKICHPFNPEVVGEKIKIKKMYFDIGGGGTNVAATLSNMGIKTALMARVGADLAGTEIIATMKKFKVDTGLVMIDKKEETGYSVIFLDKAGERTALVFRGASDFADFNPAKVNQLKAKWFFITSLNANLKLLNQLFAAAKKNKIKIAWNPGGAELELGSLKLKRMLRATDVLFLNIEEAQKLTRVKTKNIKRIFEVLGDLANKAVLVVTGGKSGAWVKNGVEILWADILDKKVVNATGAGDAFGSGFISGLILYKGNIKKSLQLAMLNSNSVVTEMGAKHGILKKPPTEKELEKIRVKAI